MVEVFVRNFLSILLIALWLLILGRVLMSWFDPATQQPGVPVPRPGHRADPRAGPPGPAPEQHVRPEPDHRAAAARDPDARRAVVVTGSESRFAVRLTPRAAGDHVDGVVEGELRARVTAPAVEGAANNALVRLLAEELGIARRDVRIVAGASSRRKLVVVDGLDPRCPRCPLAGPAGYDSALSGRLAQWLERPVHIRKVTGSNPVSPTTLSLPILIWR